MLRRGLTTMPYHARTKATIKLTAKTLGSQLGTLAIKKNLSVQHIAQITGASRTTVYSWFAGKGITNAYRSTVADLIKKLRVSSAENLMVISQKAEKSIPTRRK